MVLSYTQRRQWRITSLWGFAFALSGGILILVLPFLNITPELFSDALANTAEPFLEPTTTLEYASIATAILLFLIAFFTGIMFWQVCAIAVIPHTSVYWVEAFRFFRTIAMTLAITIVLFTTYAALYASREDISLVVGLTRTAIFLYSVNYAFTGIFLALASRRHGTLPSRVWRSLLGIYLLAIIVYLGFLLPQRSGLSIIFGPTVDSIVVTGVSVYLFLASQKPAARTDDTTDPTLMP